MITGENSNQTMRRNGHSRECKDTTPEKDIQGSIKMTLQKRMNGDSGEYKDDTPEKDEWILWGVKGTLEKGLMNIQQNKKMINKYSGEYKDNTQENNQWIFRGVHG